MKNKVLEEKFWDSYMAPLREEMERQIHADVGKFYRHENDCRVALSAEPLSDYVKAGKAK